MSSWPPSKYVNPNRPEAGVLIAELPDSIIPKCRADESFLAQVATQKFADHLPLYRISEWLEMTFTIDGSYAMVSGWSNYFFMLLRQLYENFCKTLGYFLCENFLAGIAGASCF